MISLNLSKDEYFLWLVSKVGANESYMSLCGQLYNIKFDWFVPNDDNRITDGLQLRQEYLEDFEDGIVTDMLYSDCSVLEVIIGICYRFSYDSMLDIDDCFWDIVNNLQLEKYTDNSYTRTSEKQVATRIDRFINRTYRPNGQGGLFPLSKPHEDQTKVEIWYQMSAYLMENNLLR